MQPQTTSIILVRKYWAGLLIFKYLAAMLLAPYITRVESIPFSEIFRFGRLTNVLVDINFSEL